MEPDVIKTIAAYLALAVPAAVAISDIDRLFMEWLKQRSLLEAPVTPPTTAASIRTGLISEKS